MIRICLLLLLFVVGLVSADAQQVSTPVSIPAIYNISAFPNVRGNGSTDDTAALNAALVAINAAGGGTLVLNPSSQYLINSGNLVMQTNTKLYCPAPITRFTAVVFNPTTLPCEIYLNPSFTVQMGNGVIGGVGNGSALENISIVNTLITGTSGPVSNYFGPPTAAAAQTMVQAFSGTGINNNVATIDLSHVFIMGFATCVASSRNSRSGFDYVFGDCTAGLTTDNIHDISRMNNIEIFPFLTGSQTYENTSYNISGVADNGSNLIRVTLSAPANPALSTGQQITINNVGGYTGANGQWIITVIDTTHVDLQGSCATTCATFTANTTNGFATITNMSSNANVMPGMNITGTGVPGATTVSFVQKFSGGKDLVMSNAATATNTGTTMTITNPAYTSGGTLVLDADWRTGIGFENTNSEAISCTNCFVYDHAIGFHTGTGAQWFHCINCDIDGLGTNRVPSEVGFLIDGTSHDTVWEGGTVNSAWNGMVVNYSGTGRALVAGVTLNGYTFAVGVSTQQGALELTNVSQVTGAGAGLIHDDSSVVHVVNSNWGTNSIYVTGGNQLTLKLTSVVSGSTTGTNGGSTFGMNGGQNDAVVIAGYGGGDATQGAQIRLTNTAAGATNPSKWIAATNGGVLQFMNNAFSRMAVMTDAGDFGLTRDLYFVGAVPTMTCGTNPAIDGHATNNSGKVTIGTGSPATCTITFNPAFSSWNHCSVWNEAGSVPAYTYSTTSIILNPSPASGANVDFRCDGN